MKRNIVYLTFLAVGLFASCSKDDGPVEPEGPADATITVSVFTSTKPVSGKAVDTKADDPLDTGKEATINNLQLAVFKPDGSLLAAHYEDFSDKNGLRDTIGVSAKSGAHTLVVLANCGNISYTTLDELKKQTIDLTTQKSDDLSMSSKCISVNVKAGENYIGSKKDGDFSDKVISDDEWLIDNSRIKLTRIAGRIDMKSLSVEWSEATSADLKEANAGFLLKRMFVRDSKQKSRVISGTTGSASAEDWETVEWTNEWLGDGESIVFMHGRDAEEEHYLESLDLYTSAAGDKITEDTPKEFTPLRCYVTENGLDDKEAPSPTSIIVVGDIIDKDGNPILKNRYYTIIVNDGTGTTSDNEKVEFMHIKRNYVYQIYATITGKGSPSEEKFSNASITAVVSPAPWTVAYEEHPNIN